VQLNLTLVLARNSGKIKFNSFIYQLIMETANVLIIFIASLLLGVTGYSMYTAFGPGSKGLRDPFEDHGAIRFQLEYI
jgi:PsbN protein